MTGNSDRVSPHFLATFSRRVLRMMRDNGVWFALRRVHHRVYEGYREWRLGIQTQGFIKADTLSEDPAFFDYEPTSYRCLDIALDYLNREVKDIVLLDYGAGMGRVLAGAATRPYRRLIGVEVSSELSAIAVENIDKARPQLVCQDIEVVTADATQFIIPGDVNVIFMFNPFADSVIRQVERQIQESIKSTPRKITLIFLYPPKRESNPFEMSPWLRQSIGLHTGDDELRMIVYNNVLPESRTPAQ